MNLKNFIIIAAGLFSPKLILFAAAYFYNPVDYNIFNKVYYTASLIILFASLGYNMSINRIKLKNTLLYSLVLAGSILTAVILQLVSGQISNLLDIFYLAVYAFVMSCIGIFSFQLLFESKIYKHFFLIVISTIVHIALLLINLYIKTDLYFVFFLISIFTAVLSYKILPKNVEDKEIPQFIKLGFSAFLINAAVPFALLVDKYIASHYFSTGIANSYAFAWTLIAPLFYAGNIVERLIFSSNSAEKKKLFTKAVTLQVLIIVAYIAGIQILLSYFPGLLPASVDKVLCKAIFTFMSFGYAIYILFQFPVNGVLFKFYSTAKQNITGVAHLMLTVVFLIVLAIMFSKNLLMNYHILLYVIWGFIFSTLLAKSIIIYFDSKLAAEKTGLGI